jgi:hypothetical protein
MFFFRNRWTKNQEELNYQRSIAASTLTGDGKMWIIGGTNNVKFFVTLVGIV